MLPEPYNSTVITIPSIQPGIQYPHFLHKSLGGFQYTLSAAVIGFNQLRTVQSMAADMQRMPKWVRMFLIVALISITKSCLAGATQHVVGGSPGWDLATNFRTWEQQQTFNVGDTLLFKYIGGLHNVVELGSEADYESCSVGSPVNSWNGGRNVVKLDKAGKRYFACGTTGHCSAGMKFQATTVLPQGATPPIPSVPANNATSTPAVGNANHSAAASPLPTPHIFVFFVVSVALASPL